MSSRFMALHSQNLQKTASRVAKEIDDIFRQQRSFAFSAYRTSRTISGGVRRLRIAEERPAPQITFKEYTRIASAKDDREVVFRDGKWSLASSRGVSRDIREATKTQFAALMEDAARRSQSMSRRVPLHRARLERSEYVSASSFRKLFTHKEIEPYLEVGRNQFTPHEIDNIMEREYGSLLSPASRDLCSRSTSYTSSTHVVSQLCRLNLPDSGEYDVDKQEIHVVRCFLSTDTLLHEAHHACSDTEFRAAYGNAFDEGVTQYFAGRLYTRHRQAKYDATYGENRRGLEIRLRQRADRAMDGYSRAVRVVGELAGKLDGGEDLLKRAYFTGRPGMDELEAAFERKYGEGSFARFLNIVDTGKGSLCLGGKRYRAAMAFLNPKLELEEEED